MNEEQLLMLHDVSLLLGAMRRVTEQAAVVTTKYRAVKKRAPSEKNDPIEKNYIILKKILSELDVIQDVNTISRVRIKHLCNDLDPPIDILLEAVIQAAKKMSTEWQRELDGISVRQQERRKICHTLDQQNR